MKQNKHASALAHAAQYGQTYRQKTHPLHPSATTSELRQLFNVELPEEPTPGETVIRQLIAAAEPGRLVGWGRGRAARGGRGAERCDGYV